MIKEEAPVWAPRQSPFRKEGLVLPRSREWGRDTKFVTLQKIHRPLAVRNTLTFHTWGWVFTLSLWITPVVIRKGGEHAYELLETASSFPSSERCHCNWQRRIPKWRRAGALFTHPPSLGATAVPDIWVGRCALLPRQSHTVTAYVPATRTGPGIWAGQGEGSAAARSLGHLRPHGPEWKSHILVGSMVRGAKSMEPDIEDLVFSLPWITGGGLARVRGSSVPLPYSCQLLPPLKRKTGCKRRTFLVKEGHSDIQHFVS